MKIKTPALIVTLAFAAFSSAVAIAQTTAGRNPAPAPAAHATAIPLDQIGAVAGKQYSGDGLAVTPSDDGARLRCVFQRLNGRVTTDGLWLVSTKDGSKGEPFRVIASAIGRAGTEALPGSGNVQVSGQTVRFIRSGVTEEYSVGIDGVKQDFVIAQRPDGNGPLRLELDVDGAKAEAMAGGARFVLADGGRTMVYNRLTAVDARGRGLSARMEVLSSNRLAVVLDDASAQYPVRIDPTFSDANWTSLGGFQGVNEDVEVAVVDSSGNLYIGGTFTQVGNLGVANVAEWNGSFWSSLGGGVTYQGSVANASVTAFAVSGTSVYVTGGFTAAGGVSANGIALWNGSSWSALGSGINGGASALAVSGSTLYAGGYFNTAGGVLASNIAKWNGSSWSAMGSGGAVYEGTPTAVSALAVSTSGILYVGGPFTTLNGVSANGIAQWNGSSWSGLGSGLTYYGSAATGEALAVSGNNLYVSGLFDTAGGVAVDGIAEWNGSSWSALGSGLLGPFGYAYANALATSGNNVFAGGGFDSAGGVSVNGIAEWNGSSWSALGSGVSGGIYAMAAFGNTLFAGGSIYTAGGQSVNDLAEWNGSAWSPLGTNGLNGAVAAVAIYGNNLVAAGQFTAAGGISASNIAEWNGSAWSALGSGISGGSQSTVAALAVSGANLYAGGEFTTAGGILVSNVAQWNGSSWSALGTGMNGEVQALAVAPGNVTNWNTLTNWTQTSAPNAGWWSIASSANGAMLAAVGYGGWIYTSANAGASWIQSSAPFEDWFYIACSSNGTQLAAVVNGGGIWTSSNAGANWIQTSAPSEAWSSIASSSDGTKLAAAMNGGGIWTSTNAGTTWTQTSAPNTNWWQSIASSSDGTKLAAAVYATGGGIYTSTNAGLTWTQTSAPGQGWFSIASSANGTQLAAVVWGGGVYTSTNTGATWTLTSAPGEYWHAIASSANGTQLAAVVADGGIWTSGNAGATWSQTAAPVGQYWASIASSADGTELSAVANGGGIWTTEAATQPVTLLYAGGFFTAAGGVTASRVAEWNSLSWSALGAGIGGQVNALAISGTNLYAGGYFQTAGGLSIYSLAQWNGSGWSSVGSEAEDNEVFALAMSGTNLYVGGSGIFAGSTNANDIAEWNGNSWSTLGTGVPFRVRALAASNGTLFAGGDSSSESIAEWNGSSWSGSGVSGGGAPSVLALAVSGENLFAGGSFTSVGTNACANIAEANIPPYIQFTANPTAGVEALAVQFSSPAVDSAGNAIVSWNWSFGDGSTSTSQNPTHTYTTAGPFNPALVATNSLNQSVSANGPSITVNSANVQFTANPTNGVEPLTVQFSCPSVDSGTNAIVSWNWNFNDGSTSTNQNPSHAYLTTGTFHPGLVVTNIWGDEIAGSGPSITVTSTPPIVSFSPLTNGQQVASLANIGGFVSFNFSLASTATFSIHELDINGGLGRWWNGTNFLSVSNSMPATITGTNWAPALGVVLPQLNPGLNYQLFVTVTNASSRASATITVQAPITLLTWDPGVTSLGTQVLNAPNTNGGNYLFEIVPQTPAYGVWRTALNVLAGQAGLYMQEGSSQYIYSDAPWVSDRTGSNGFVLDASQFSAGQPWYILVSATTNASWNLVTGDIFVYNLGSLAADNSSSTNITMGAEGMAFFKTTVPPSTLAWQLWLDGLATNLCVKKSSAPDVLASDYDLNQVGQMLVVPPYLDGQTYDGYYFISAPALPGTPINLDSRQQPITSLPFGTNVTVTSAGFPYVTYQVQVPAQPIAWQLNLSPSNGAPAIAARLAQVPNEFNNDAYSDVPGGIGNSISLVPPAGSGEPGLSAGSYYVTVYGTGTFSCGFTNGNPVITPVCFFFSVTNDAPNRVGWRYYSVLDINSQLGSLGWELILSNAPAGSQIAVRRTAVPGEWNFRDYEYDNDYTPGTEEYADQWSIQNVLQQPRHQADIWYIGVYSPTQALGNFILTGQQFNPQPIGFDNSSNIISVINQPGGWWNFFKVIVPPDTNLLGWDLRLTNVTAGSPQLVVCQDELASGLSTYGLDWIYNDLAWAGTTWLDGDQWQGGTDWTGEPDNPNGSYANVNMLEMGMGNPLQPGTYYVGVYDPSGYADTYTLESRGIGPTNYSIPVTPLNWSNGIVTNTLAPREAAYYSVVIPTNTPNWHVLLTPTNGQAILLAQEKYLPNVGAAADGSAAYPAEEYNAILDPSGGILMEKLGNEHYLLLPPNGQSSIPAGTYYLGVVSEGVNPVMGSEIGSNATTYVLQNLGPLPVINLGVAGTNDLFISNSLAGGDVAAYQVTLPPGLWSNTNRVDAFITLTNVTQGAPTISVVQGTNIPSTSDGYGVDGGASGSYPTGASTDPTPGIYTLAVQQTSPYADTSYGLDIHLRFTGFTPMSYDSAGNSMSVTNQPAGWWRYFQVVVPSDTNLLGWDLRLTNVTSGYPQMVVCNGELPLSGGTSGPDWPFGTMPQAGRTWAQGDRWDGEVDWTGDSYNPNGSYVDVNMLEMGMGNPLQPGTYYVGVYDEYGEYADSYTLESRGIGITNYSIPVLPLNGSVTNTLAPREAAYYSVVIPTNTPGWRVLLTPTNGQAILLAQENYLPNVGAAADGSAAYPAEEVNPPTGGMKMEKLGNEHYVLLPENGQSSILAGTYYLGVVSEGVNPEMGYEIGTNATTYVLQNLGPLPVINLGIAGTNDLFITNSLAGGDVAAYQFTLPPGLWSNTNRVDMFVSLTNVTEGSPIMSLVYGTNIPSTSYAGYGDDGGVGAQWSGYSSINPSADPAPGVYTLAVQQTSPYSDTSYAVDVHLRITGFTPMSYDSAGNSMSVTNQPAGWWHYFQIVVPSDTNLLGWDLRLTNVTSGDPQMVVCNGELPLSSGTFGMDWPYESMPWGGITWSEGDQWDGEMDWTGEQYNPDGSYPDVNMLEMGMGNPLQPGTYYVGVYDGYGGYADSYTLESRGIGITNYSIPVLPLNWTNGVVTNTLAPREAAYYSLVIPTNSPSWHVLLAPTSGDAILLAQKDYLPNVEAVTGGSYGGSAAYPAEYGLDPSGGIKMQKVGNEHYLLLPENGQSSIPAGTYYLGVVSEGVNSVMGSEIGSNATTYVLQSLGPLPITNLGMLGSSDLAATNALLEGGDFSAYQFAIPTNILGVELSLQGVVGNPSMSLAESSLLPGAYYPYPYFDSSYFSSDGGEYSSWSGLNLITLRNPDSGTYSLLMNAATDSTGQNPDASYTLQVMPLPTPLLNISSLLNTNGGTNVATGTLADTESAFYEVIVPATVDGAPVLGWNLNLTESSGSAMVRVRPNALPDNNCDTTEFESGSIVVAPPYLAPGIWYVEVNASGSTTFTLTSSVITTNSLTRSPWVMPTTAQTNTAPGLVLPEFGDTGVDTNGAALPGDQGVNLAQGQYDFYAIIVPTNNAGLLRTELQAISGNPNLYIRVGAMPTTDHYASGSCYDGSSLVDRALTGGNTEYGNWVPLNGQTATNLTPGMWIMSVYASGTDARYRLQLSCGTPITNLPAQSMPQGGMCMGGSTTNGNTIGLVQILPLDGSVTYTNQQLAGGDWRYYLAQIPSNAPNDWVVTWTAAEGSPHLFIRDTVPPGDAVSTSDYNSYPGSAISWLTDAKNEGPYPTFASPGSETLSTPPLRPGSAYYLGFWSPDDATFSVTCITNSGYIDITNVVTLYQGQIAGTVPPYGCIEYQVNLPANATGVVLNATNSANVILTLEQGTVAIPGGPAHWTSSSTNSSLNEPFNGTWPWLSGYTYYLTVTNDSAVTGTFELTSPALAPQQPLITGLTLSGGNLVISASSGTSGATYNLLMATNLALPISEWTTAGSNTLTTSGNFSITVTNATTARQRFYILQKR